jgi:uncharacterized membrane protein
MPRAHFTSGEIVTLCGTVVTLMAILLSLVAMVGGTGNELSDATLSLGLLLLVAGLSWRSLVEQAPPEK